MSKPIYCYYIGCFQDYPHEHLTGSQMDIITELRALRAENESLKVQGMRDQERLKVAVEALECISEMGRRESEDGIHCDVANQAIAQLRKEPVT